MRNFIIALTIGTLIAFAGGALASTPNVHGLGNVTTNPDLIGWEGEVGSDVLVVCPPGATLEGEPTCYDNYVDTYNGGCNSSPAVFQTLSCGETVCGTSGTFMMDINSYRDTDWYEVTLSADGPLTWTATCDFPSLIFIIDSGSGNCADYVILGSATGIAGQTISLTFPVTAGTYWLWIGPSVFGVGAPCPADYVATVDCASCCFDISMVNNGPNPVAPGGSFNFNGILTNTCNTAEVVSVKWGVVYNGNFFQQGQLNNINVPAGQTLNGNLTQGVPGFAPAGTYEYRCYATAAGETSPCDSFSFPFTVSAARAEGGYTEWTAEGNFVDPGSMPSQYSLVGNYPNPFNATTTIAFDTPEAGNVSVEVFNLNGQKVATLVNGFEEAGQHTVSWDAANYSSGIYFYKLNAGETVITKRMTLLK